MTVELTSRFTSQVWSLTCVYGPCNGPERSYFVARFKNIQIDGQQNWLFLEDFNFYISVQDRNKIGADMNDIFIFNVVISSLGLLENPLKQRRFTWSNMQQNPLLERLDWVFTSTSWTLSFPNTMSSLWPGISLIMFRLWSRLIQKSLSPQSSHLKISGWKLKVSLILSSKFGCKNWKSNLQNAFPSNWKFWGRNWSFGVRTCLDSCFSWQIVIKSLIFLIF